jgi:hypothetical protein
VRRAATATALQSIPSFKNRGPTCITYAAIAKQADTTTTVITIVQNMQRPRRLLRSQLCPELQRAGSQALLPPSPGFPQPNLMRWPFVAIDARPSHWALPKKLRGCLPQRGRPLFLRVSRGMGTERPLVAALPGGRFRLSSLCCRIALGTRAL